MRIVIDLQGAQTESRFRGIGRYSLSLALGVARNAGEHEIWLALSAALPDSIPAIRQAFEGLVPKERIRVFDVPRPVAEHDPSHGWRARAAEKIREHFIEQLHPDAVLVTSLFEGYVDDGVVSVGAFTDGARTAVILYDLIPLLNPASYLPTPAQRQYYDRKIASLKNAGLLLSISDYSRQEAIDALDLPPDRVVSISTAVDGFFKPGVLAPDETARLRERLGITRDMVMYAPGGFDARKNIDGLIAAYGLLPRDLREKHQLVIASKLGTREREQLLRHSQRAGLAEDELVLTGYVGDDELAALYGAAALFVFPSKHEGFGLPALEAMACGAPVIGAATTSVPEVIGLDEALFDPMSPRSIADKIEQVLGDDALRQRLREHGAVQAKKFSWDISGQRALRALEAHAAAARPADEPLAAGITRAARPRLAFVSPLPPEKTGIANYSIELLPALAKLYDIELIVEQPQCALPPELAGLPQRSAEWFHAHADSFDRVVYQFGNSPFHSHMLALLREHPGVVVLHDFFLSGMLFYEETTGAMPTAWSEALYRSHGYMALKLRHTADCVEAAKQAYPCNLDVIRGARAVIVHSEHSRALARQWYGEQAARDWSVIPHLRTAAGAIDRAAARKKLGMRAEAFVICSFGFVDPTKQSLRLAQAWLASRLRDDPACELVLVGANHGGDYGRELTELIRAAGCGDRIRITGWTDDDTYNLYLQAADASVQLRSLSRGETSGAVLHCLNYGLPTIVNANGSMADLADDAVIKLPDAFDDDELTAALESLRDDAGQRARLREAASRLIRTRHDPDACARQYAEAIEAAYRRRDDTALLEAIAAIPDLHTDEQALQQLAQSIAKSSNDPLAQRQFLVDVSSIARNDLQTGIERVARAQLLELLRRPPRGYRVEPVYLSCEGGAWHYRYACGYAKKLLAIDTPALADAPVDIGAQDVFYSPDFHPEGVVAAAKSGLYADWRARGVEVNFLVHDILPILRPEFFPDRADESHAQWLACVAANADRLVCISQAVADETRRWLEQQVGGDGVAGIAAVDLARLKFAVVHHGADIDASAPTTGLPQDAERVLARLGAAPSFLMVGTIEPRKGHLQALAAFDQLWRAGENLNLVIVGKEGWKPVPQEQRRTIPEIVDRLNGHPELGKRLFWLQGISDEYLQKIYASAACLIFASEAEGFGLPLIEAARHGLPIIARDIPVFREVAQRHAHYFSGSAGADLAEAIRAWLRLQAEDKAPASSGMPSRTWAENAQQLTNVLIADPS
ncbi:MAG TPA: glycosyltransferase [Paucimonas sp.]|nr:glycosyltransferase [Paucimonas sp.]